MRPQLEYKEFVGALPDAINEASKKQHDKGFFFDFRFDCLDGVKLQCRIWEEAFTANQETLTPLTKLVVGGDFRLPNFLTVRLVRNPNSSTSKREQIIKDYGSLAAYQEQMTKKCERMKRSGMVPIWEKEGWNWQPKERCIHHLGAWKLKIEFCMDYLGGAYVTRRLRAADLSYSKVSQDFKKRYEEVLEKLVTEAKYLAGGSDAQETEQVREYQG